MLAVGIVLAGVAALLHVYIFWLESLAWTTPRARAIFGTTPEQAETTRELAFNQGFYNLFLATAVVLGIVVAATGGTTVGLTLVLVGVGSMAAAALVLLLSSPDKARSALIQGAFPVLAIIAIAVGMLTTG